MSSRDVSLSTVYPYIGEVCAIWAEIEFYLIEFIYLLAQYQSRHYVSESVSIPFEIVLRNAELKQKVDSARSLAHYVTEDKNFYEDTDAVLKTIYDKLRFVRNRLIHDDWIEGEGATAQIQYFGRVRNLQAKKRAVLFRDERVHADTSQLDAELERFRDALNDVQKLHARLRLILWRRSTRDAPPR